MLKFIEDCMASKRFYIESGLLEPVHLETDERKRLVEGMWDSVENIREEAENAHKRFQRLFNERSDELIAQLQRIGEFREKFMIL